MQGLLFIFHVIDEVFPDVVDGFDVIAALLHQREAAVPTEAHESDAALDAQPRCFQMLTGFGHGRAGTDGIVNEDDRFRRVYHPLDEFQRAMFFALFANEQTAITTTGLKYARLKDGHGGQSIGGDLPTVEAFEKFEDAAPGQFRAAPSERDGERIEHPTRRCAIARKHWLCGRAVKDAVSSQQFEQLRALRVKTLWKR